MSAKNQLCLALLLILGCFSAPGQEITIEAESGVITAPFIVSNACVFQLSSTPITNGGKAEYTVNISVAGSYAVQFLINAPSPSNNVVAVAIDAEPEDPNFSWDIATTSGFEPKFLAPGKSGAGRSSPKYFQLSAGAHRLVVRGGGANVQIDRLMLFKKPTPPQKARIRVT